MPTNALPIIKTFQIPSLSWAVTDFRNLDYGQQAQTKTRWEKAVVENNEAQGISRDEVICAAARRKHRFDADQGFARAYQSDPTTDYEAYFRANPIKRFRFHPRDDRAGVLLGVESEGRIIGGICCTNYTAENETRRKLTARSMLWVGVEPVRDREELDVWMDAIAFMIDNDLELEDGRILDFIGYDFISDDHLKRDLPSRAPIRAFVERLAEHFDGPGSPDDAGDVKYRRRGAAPPGPASRGDRGR